MEKNKKFSYMVILPAINHADLGMRLTKLGKEGWEFVQFIEQGPLQERHILVRKAEEVETVMMVPKGFQVLPEADQPQTI